MTHHVEEFLQVHIHRKDVPLLYVFTTFQKCLVGTAMGAEPIARLTELRLIKLFEHLTDSLLHHTVNNRRDTKTTFLAVRLRYLYPADRIRFVCAFTEGCHECRAVLL